MKHMKHKERPAPMCTQWNRPMKHYETCGEPRSGTAAECAYDNSYTCCSLAYTKISVFCHKLIITLDILSSIL